jgi:GNAT superfamily N-acetyltransferase
VSIVRRATAADVPAVVRMGRAFIDYLPHSSAIGAIVDDESMSAQAHAWLASDATALFVADRDGDVCAMLVGALVPLWFAPRTVMAAELAWWVEPRARGTTVAVRLVRAYEEWARASGATVTTMSSLDGCNGADVATMLSRLGYTRSEMTYLKGTPCQH